MSASWIFFVLLVSPVFSDPKLELLHVIFSHKLYAPVQTTFDGISDSPEKLDYRFFLENTDDMVNSAKMDMFNLGVQLRLNYDKFLGDIYHPDIMEVRTSEYVLSMISAQIVDAGIWPPVDIQRWSDELDWQPITTDYKPVEEDTLMLGAFCPILVDEERKVHQQWESRISIHDPFLDYVSTHYGQKVQRPSDIALIYSYLETSADQNATLPSWAEDIFPDGEMKNVTLLSYDLQAQTLLQKQLIGGTMLKKIIKDTEDHKNSSGMSKRKLYMYSGEERNLIGVLQSMGIWSPHILNTGAALLFEVYSNSSINDYSVKMFYWPGDNMEKIQLKLPGCDDDCPLSNFSTILREVIPDNEMTLCHQQRIEKDKTNNAMKISYSIALLITLMCIFVI